MPRNSSGTYSAPSGNPVVTRTSISSTWANNTVADVGTELTSSLDRNGRGGMLAPLPLSNGSAALPALTFSSETTSGLYRNGSSDIRAAVGGTDVLALSATGASAPLGFSATQSQSNTAAVTATGNGTAAAVVGSGGSSNGSGVQGTGGGTSGYGGYFTGGSSGVGVRGASGASGGIGVEGVGGTGSNAFGVKGTGDGTGVGLQGVPGSGTIVAVRSDGAVDFSFMSAIAGTLKTTASDKLLTYANLVRARGRFTFDGNADPTAVSGFNISTVKNTGTGSFYVELAFDMGTNCTATFSDFCTSGSFKKRTVEVLSQTVVGGKTRIPFQVVDTSTGAVVTPDALAAAGFNIIVSGV